MNSFAHPQTSATLPTDPAAFVRKLYSEVTWYHPLEILDSEYVGRTHPKLIDGNAARKRFMRYLSASLRHRIALNDACLRDLEQQYRKSPVPLKLPVFEGGIFSGGDERGEPNRFELENVMKHGYGSFLASVTLADALDLPEKDSWRVKVLLVRHGKALGVEDVIYVHEFGDSDETLSAILTTACKIVHSPESDPMQSKPQ